MGQQMANSNGNWNGNGHGEVDYESMKFTELRKANLANFQGTYDPDATNEWMKETGKIFSILICIEEQKVLFATFLLKADVEF